MCKVAIHYYRSHSTAGMFTQMEVILAQANEETQKV